MSSCLCPNVSNPFPNARFLDVSLALGSGLPLWPGGEPLRRWRVSSLAEGQGWNISALSCDLHAGTHLDAPLHALAGGTPVDRLPLDSLLGPAWVAEIRGVDLIEESHLRALAWPDDCPRILFKTDNSDLWARQVGAFQTKFTALSPGAAAYLVERGVKLVGVDYLSVEPYQGDGTVHRVFLEAGVVIVESLDLSQAPAGPCRLNCLPLKVAGGEGAPARVILEYPPEKID